MTQVSRRSAALATLLGNGATVAITVAQAFLLIPLALLHLDASLYGAWLAASELLIWIQFLDGGLPNLLTQRAGAAVGRGDYIDAARWASTCIAGLAAVGVALLTVAVTVAPFVGTWSQAPVAERAVFVDCFRIGVLASVLLLLANGFVGLARGVQRTAVVNATQVAGALAGLIVSMAMLVAGAGLWAFAIGLLVRSLTAVCGAVLFLRSLPAPWRMWWACPSRAHARELRALVPSMSSASIGNVVANNSEILLVNTLLGPVPALVYALSRRAFEGARNLLDTIAWAAAGGFAHLVTADDKHRARGVLHAVLWGRFALACLAGAVVLAVNEPFVELLFGQSYFGGLWLNLAFATQLIAVGQSFLANFLWRATGHIREGAWLLALEALVRVAAMAGALWLVGPAAGPLAAVAVSLVMLYLTWRRLDASLPPGVDGTVGLTAWLSGLAVLVVGLAVASIQVAPSWTRLCLCVVAIASVGGVFLFHTRPSVVRGGAVLPWEQFWRFKSLKRARR